ncbi:hypothetical protein ARMGADRAFT_184871 [Armillaria gallica]|uniref:Uncharacterized protein n=1 Tax=Armillaria gallica TaxID=47427 RepID=A0A2H3CJ09_ARMGA|nr:hypothetical protein ARMGADRAFT_184871 [Armillaria gallica]
MVIINLANFSIVVTFADQAERELGRLNILVRNTSMATREYEQVEGWKRILRANNLVLGLLAIRMIPKMLETACKHSAVQRLVIVANDMHYWTTIEKNVIAGPSIITKL